MPREGAQRQKERRAAGGRLFFCVLCVEQLRTLGS
jgi:hypothetical protein